MSGEKVSIEDYYSETEIKVGKRCGELNNPLLKKMLKEFASQLLLTNQKKKRETKINICGNAQNLGRKV